MSALVFIGDEAAAAGWRLAGVDARVVEPGSGPGTEPGMAGMALARALDEAQLVLVAAEVAARIPEPQLRAALRRLTPVTVVVPDLREAVPYPDVAARMKRQLGIES